MLAPGRLVTDPIDAMSLGLALMLGTAGLPHILMRFYTVPDAQTARTSVGYATAFIGFFYLLTFILGFGAMVIVGREAITAVDAGGNMAAPLLAEAVGGTPFLGFIAAVAFATILAVVAGPDAVGRGDAVARPVGERRPRRACRRARAARGGARRDGRPRRSCRSCSASRSRDRTSPTWWAWRSRLRPAPTFPALVLSIFWKRLTTAGAQASMIVGTVSTLVLIYLSPTIQIDILKHAEALVPAAESRAS